jgi:hypothetical protein
MRSTRDNEGSLGPEGSFEQEKLANLESEIRKLGLPYNDPAPDAAYWANFRVRVLEQAERKRGFSAVSEWIAGHLVSSGLVGAGLAAALFLAVFGLPQSEPAVAPTKPVAIAQALTERPATTEPQQKPSNEPRQNAFNEPQATLAQRPSSAESPANRVRSAQRTEPGIAQAATDDRDALIAEATPAVAESAARPLLVSSESEYPVSLSELSDVELESVYDGLMSLDSAE